MYRITKERANELKDECQQTQQTEEAAPQLSTPTEDVNLEDEPPQRTFLLVASIANIFQGFDSGIYKVIISENPFINLFNVSGTRSGIVASMVNLDNVLGNLFVASWCIWYLGRGSAFGLGTIVLLVDVALQEEEEEEVELEAIRLGRWCCLRRETEGHHAAKSGVGQGWGESELD